MLIGYRTEAYSGSGNRDLLLVVNFEREEHGNDHVAEDYDIDKLYEQGYYSCVWVCDTPYQIGECYFEHIYLADEDYQVDRYEFEKDYIILCDLGPEGKLIAYKECKVIEAFDYEYLGEVEC